MLRFLAGVVNVEQAGASHRGPEGLGRGMQKHEWRAEDDEGVVFHRAEYHASRWRLISQRKGEEEWTEHDPVSRELWGKLRVILFNKYQRKRVPWRMIERIDKILEDLEDE